MKQKYLAAHFYFTHFKMYVFEVGKRFSILPFSFNLRRECGPMKHNCVLAAIDGLIRARRAQASLVLFACNELLFSQNP